VIPVRNDAARLRDCLNSIHASAQCSEIEILVVDNGSTDNSVEVARKGDATVLSLPGLRVSALRNRGAAAASGDLLAFIDSDHEIGRGWVSSAFQSLEDGSVAAAGALCYPPRNPTWVQRIYDGLRDHRAGRRDVNWLGSGNLVVRRDAFVAVGGFDQELEVCEDVDLCQKLRAAGYRLVSNPRLESIHNGDPRSLSALFAGELWRGRDNLKVTLRGPLTWSELPSLVIPIVNLVLASTAIVATLIAGRTGLMVVTTTVVVFSAFALLRALRIFSRLGTRNPLDLLRSWVVAAVYDAARALALVVRVPHRRSQTSAATAPASLS